MKINIILIACFWFLTKLSSATCPNLPANINKFLDAIDKSEDVDVEFVDIGEDQNPKKRSRAKFIFNEESWFIDKQMLKDTIFKKTERGNITNIEFNTSHQTEGNFARLLCFYEATKSTKEGTIKIRFTVFKFQQPFFRNFL